MSEVGTVEVAIRTKRSEARFVAHNGERLLFAGLRNGFALPYDCVSGSCGSCQAEVAKAAEGAIEDAFPLAPASRSLRPGRVLMCQSLCRGEVDLRLFATIAPLAPSEVRPDYVDGWIESISELATNTISFAIRTARPLHYLPGQFAMISADGVPGYRAYSMTRAQQRDSVLEFVIKVTPTGSFSRWMRAHARPKSAVRLFGPLGRAVLRSDDRNDLLAITGGTGIAGIMAVLESAVESRYLETRRARVIFGLRSPSDAFFLDRLSALVHAVAGRLEVVVAIADAGSDVLPSQYPRLQFSTGLVLEVAENVLGPGPLGEACCFVAGPPAVVDGGIALLCGRLGVDARSVRFDRFH